MEPDRCLEQGGQIRWLWRGGPLQARSLRESLRKNADHSAVIFGGVGKSGPQGQWALNVVLLDSDPAL